MNPAASIVTLFVVVGCCFCWAYMWYCKDQDRRDRERLGDIMTARESVARHLYGETVEWDPRLMTLFDHNVSVRAPWLSHAEDLISSRSQYVQARGA